MRLNAIPGCDGKNQVNIKKRFGKVWKVIKRDVAIFANIPYNITRPFFGRLFFVCSFFDIMTQAAGGRKRNNMRVKTEKWKKLQS